MKTAIVLVIIIGALGLVGGMDLRSQRLEAAAKVCDGLTPYTTPTYTQCLNNQLEMNGDK